MSPKCIRVGIADDDEFVRTPDDEVGRRLSAPGSPVQAAAFLEGFFEVNAVLLCRNRQVVQALDAFQYTELPTQRPLRMPVQDVYKFDQRRIIARVLSDAQDHPDVEALHRRAAQVDPGISLATVYRTVRLFEEAGRVFSHGLQMEYWRAHADRAASAVKVEAMGPVSPPAAPGQALWLVRYEIPVYDRRWNGSFVRGDVGGRPIVGAVNDWVTEPDIYAAARARSARAG